MNTTFFFQLEGYNSKSSQQFPECANMAKIAEHLKFWFTLIGGSLDSVVKWSSMLADMEIWQIICFFLQLHRLPHSLFLHEIFRSRGKRLHTSFHIIIINLILYIRSLRFSMTTRTVLGSCSPTPAMPWPSRRRPTSTRCSPSCQSSEDPSASLSASLSSQSGIGYSC